MPPRSRSAFCLFLASRCLARSMAFVMMILRSSGVLSMEACRSTQDGPLALGRVAAEDRLEAGQRVAQDFVLQLGRRLALLLVEDSPVGSLRAPRACSPAVQPEPARSLRLCPGGPR